MKIFNFYKKIFLLINFVLFTNLFLANFSGLNAMQQTTSTTTTTTQEEPEIEEISQENIRWQFIFNAIQNKLESLKKLQDKLKAKKAELEKLIKNKADIPNLNSKLETANRYIERLNAFIEFENNTAIAVKIEKNLKEKINNTQFSPNMSPEAIVRLNLYANQENPNNYLFQIIDRTQLSFAKAFLSNRLSTNPQNIDLDTESAKFHALELNSDFFNQLNSALSNFAQAEKLFFEEIRTLKKDTELINSINAVISSNSWSNFSKNMAIASSHIWAVSSIEKLVSRPIGPYEGIFYFGIPTLGIPGVFQNSLDNILQPTPEVSLPEQNTEQPGTLIKEIDIPFTTKKYSLHFVPSKLKKLSTYKDAILSWASATFPKVKSIPFINPTLQFLYKKYAIKNLNKIKKELLIKHIKNMQIILNSIENINNIIKNYPVFNNLSEQIESLINNQTQPNIATAINSIREELTGKINLSELEQKFEYIRQVSNSKINEKFYFLSIIKNTAELDYFVSLVKLKRDQEFLSKITAEQRIFFAQTNILC
ncbi:hypothetical protein K9M16_04510 [Candidatus Babeliales bacterium]|nr:hypothetical protein [Candidatus Babeliales bacterium]